MSRSCSAAPRQGPLEVAPSHLFYADVRNSDDVIPFRYGAENKEARQHQHQQSGDGGLLGQEPPYQHDDGGAAAFVLRVVPQLARHLDVLSYWTFSGTVYSLLLRTGV